MSRKIMALNKIVMVTLAVVILLIETCEAGLLEDILEFILGFKFGKRSLSDAITNYLDDIFPKDDIDSDLLKELFMLYSEEDENSFNSEFVGIEVGGM